MSRMSTITLINGRAMNRISPWRSIRRWLTQLDRRLGLTKRQVFVTVTLLLTAGLLLTQLVSHEYRYPMVIILMVVSYFFSALALRRDLRGIEWITLLSLPSLFTASVALFYFLLPVRWLTRIPVVVAYGVGMYALLLTENIYNVAAERSIALLRAAHTVGFLLTLITHFLLVQTLLAFRFNALINTVGTGIISAILLFQTLWAIELKESASDRLKAITFALMIVFMQLAWILSFWPVKPTLQALFLTTVLYSTGGMAQQYLVERLYRKTVVEFTVVSVLVFMLMMLATSWRGNV